MTAWLDDNRYQIDSSRARKFFNQHATQINWEEFNIWATDAWEKDGYEWLIRINADGPESEDFMK